MSPNVPKLACGGRPKDADAGEPAGDELFIQRPYPRAEMLGPNPLDLEEKLLVVGAGSPGSQSAPAPLEALVESMSASSLACCAENSAGKPKPSGSLAKCGASTAPMSLGYPPSKAALRSCARSRVSFFKRAVSA